MSCGFTNNIYKQKYNSFLLGKVDVPFILEGWVRGVQIKVIDIQQHRLNINNRYDKGYLRSLQSTIAKDGTPAIDIYFNIHNYLEFLYLKLGRLNVDNSNCVIALWNVPDLDNAYYTGQYMVFGNGKTEFKPLVSPDVISHELTHGLVQTICGLQYKGHSGALNESLSDVIAIMYEFYLYQKYNEDKDISNNLLGQADWEIGEDIMKNNRHCLRDFINPNSQKQPMRMNDMYYIDPNSNFDYGGVHYNSGIINHLFYQICLKEDKNDVLELWYRVYKKLKPDSDFKDFTDIIKGECPIKMFDTVYKSLVNSNLIK